MSCTLWTGSPSSSAHSVHTFVPSVATLWPKHINQFTNTNLVRQCSQAANETVPEISEERPVDLLQPVLGAGVNTDIQLSNRHEIPAQHQTSLYLHRLRLSICHRRNHLYYCIIVAVSILLLTFQCIALTLAVRWHKGLIQPALRPHSHWHEYRLWAIHTSETRTSGALWSLVQAQTLVIQSPLKIWWKLWKIKLVAKVNSNIAGNVVYVKITSHLHYVLYK